MKSYAILLAAGAGLRTGLNVPKQLVKIKDKEIILHSLEIFTKSNINFDAVVIATPPSTVFGFNWSDFFKKNTAGGDIKKLHIITGGAARQDSVDNSIKYLESILPASEAENAIVFIHDAARPFVKDEELSLLLDKAAVHGAAFLCSQATETIKEINSQEINFDKSILPYPLKLKTVKRDNLISAKTPQVFKFNIIKKALHEARRTGFTSTDDISLVENLGLTVVPILSTDFNIKITSALDIEIAELLCDKFK
ncbi:MAG: 2-C-methyl-D-erythritol 4-phosphate cytidylyltransferase [Candidatus Acidulodesulfobacterium ferriphilum]|jgi:4-diphosphocytidyl-2-methyl-D-erithritol synthase|uniref:2-C-methyl-D-erythritol 4-phosphate cytidylyltransferase n=1 Tax=Candidatus Acidulodesulfobacterium ferriphilum TaxID=2597223 RepID=A0A519BA55_9DELT|nr:MAG: 2-C-methyl-D-erythritol 4-phosphate cytidylyltransferase [Candidatus Acidulodesulfobacterium ferriphilum]